MAGKTDFGFGIANEIVSEFGLEPSDFYDFAGRKPASQSVIERTGWYQEYKRLLERVETAMNSEDRRALIEALFWAEKGSEHVSDILRKHFSEEEAALFERAVSEYREMRQRILQRRQRRKELKRLTATIDEALSAKPVSEKEITAMISEILKTVRQRYGAKAKQRVAAKISEMFSVFRASSVWRKYQRKQRAVSEIVRHAFLANKEAFKNALKNEGWFEEYTVVSAMFRETIEKVRALYSALSNEHAPASRGEDAGEK